MDIQNMDSRTKSAWQCWVTFTRFTAIAVAAGAGVLLLLALLTL